MKEVFNTDKITFLHVEELPEEGAMAVFSYPTKELSQKLQDNLIKPQTSETNSIIIVTVGNNGEVSTVIRNGKAPYPFVMENHCVAKLINTLRQQLQAQKSYGFAR